MTQDAALVIKVAIREDSGVYYANSTDLIGLHVCGTNLEQTYIRVIKAIKALFKHSRGLDVEVHPTTDMEAFPEAKIPTETFVVHRCAL